MRIVHVLAYFQPNLGYQEYYLALEQQRLGHEVHVVTSDRYTPWRGVWGGNSNDRIVGSGIFKEEELTVHRLPCVFEFGAYVTVKNMVKKLRELKPEIVHAHEVQNIIAAEPAFFKNVFKYGYVLDTHTFLYRYVYKNLKGKILYFTLKNLVFNRSVKAADAIVAVTPACRRWFADEFNIDIDDIPIIPLGADLELFKPDPAIRYATRAQLGVEEEDILIVHVGRIAREDLIDMLLTAIGKTHFPSQRVKILLVGSGDEAYANELRTLAKKLNINLFFSGLVHRKHIGKIYNAADIGVWLSRQPISIIEAIASGLPVIIPKEYPPGNYPYADNVFERHLIEYNNGFCFNEGNLIELTACLEKMLKDEDIRRQMRRRARRLAEDRFDWKIISKEYLNLYEKILALKV